MVRINSAAPENRELASRFALRGVPTVVLLNGEGAEVDRIIGYDERGDFLKTLLGYLYGVDTLDDYLARSKEDASAEIRSTIAEKYFERGNAAECLTWVGKAREALKAPDPKLSRQLDLSEGAAWLQTSPMKGENALVTLALNSPKEPEGEEAFSIVRRHLEKKGNMSAVLALFHGLLPSKQDDPDFLNDYAWTCAEKGLELDKALEAAKRAVELSKEDPGILDTLAEVYFKMGNQKDAVATIQRAILQRPDDEYFRKQKEKFLAKSDPGKGL